VYLIGDRFAVGCRVEVWAELIIPIIASDSRVSGSRRNRFRDPLRRFADLSAKWIVLAELVTAWKLLWTWRRR